MYDKNKPCLTAVRQKGEISKLMFLSAIQRNSVSNNAPFMKQCSPLLNLYLPPSKLNTDTPLLGLGETADQSLELYAS
jgi:hypothetical protein